MRERLTICFLLGLLLACIGGPALARTADASPPLPAGECPRPGAAIEMSCAETPGGYRSGWLSMVAKVPEGTGSVAIRASRFESVAVRFTYADGVEIRDSVRAGAFADHWRVGGAIAFPVPAHDAPLTSVRLDVERPDWARLLDVRIGAAPDGNADAATILLIGGALTLLALSALGNVLVGAASRQAAPIWNAAWAICVLFWGLLWTQVALFFVPAIAGPVSARLATLFSTMAIACAIGFFLASPGRALAGLVRLGIAAVAVAVAATGAGAAATPGAWLPTIALLLNGAVGLSALIVTTTGLVAWRRGDSRARSFLLSFLIPMAAVLISTFADRGLDESDAGGLYMVLVACSLQTLWLTIAGAHHLWSVRHERDAARAAESRITRIAETDGLTGILNRRGFVERAEALLGGTQAVTLVLLDLDRFKSVNDTHGHDVGDEVLRATAAALTWLADAEAIGRLGGEEFGILAAGLDPDGAIALANQARAAISGEDVQTDSGFIAVTASAGVCCVPPGTAFATLYKAADKALYAAKEAGRDRTEVSAALARVV